MKIGDHVECKHDVEWQNKHRQSDNRKRKALNLHGQFRWNSFHGNAAAYMYLDEAYVVEAVTETGGLRLRGFAIPVSQNDVQISTKPVFR